MELAQRNALRKKRGNAKWLATIICFLAAPTLSFGGGTPSSVTLAWDGVTNTPISGYRVYWGTVSGIYTDVIETGQRPTMTVSGLSNGVTYYFAVTAHGSDGAEGDFSSEISFTPGGTNLPVVTLSSPIESIFQEPADISLTATVNPNTHVIDRVQFFNGTTLLGQAIRPPYSLRWSNIPAGNYSVLARALFDGSNTVDSGTATLTVASARPSGDPLLQVGMTADGQIQITGTGASGASYDILASQDFITWILLGHTTADDRGSFAFIDSTPPELSARFYRAIETAASDPVLQISMGPDGQAQIGGTGPSGASYDIFASQDLITWILLGNVTTGATGTFSFTDSTAPSFPARFYRASQR